MIAGPPRLGRKDGSERLAQARSQAGRSIMAMMHLGALGFLVAAVVLALILGACSIPLP